MAQLACFEGLLFSEIAGRTKESLGNVRYHYYRGIADHIVAVKSFDDAITRQAVKTVQGWKFKPAIGPDGKPFAVRLPIETTFRLLRQ